MCAFNHNFRVGDRVAASDGYYPDGSTRPAKLGQITGFHGPDRWPLVQWDNVQSDCPLSCAPNALRLENDSESVELLVATVRELAAKYPENVYCPPCGRPNRPCHYNQGQCTHHGVGCIMGQALIACGLVNADDGVLSIQQDICELLTDLNYFDHCRYGEWLTEVQIEQDKGYTWAEAIEIADRISPIAE